MKASQRLQELAPLVKHKFAFNFACQFSYLMNKVVLEEVSFFCPSFNSSVGCIVLGLINVICLKYFLLFSFQK